MTLDSAPTLDMGLSVSFNCQGSRLMGSLHQPAGVAASTGVILLNQGPIDRAGSHRLYIKLAARLVAIGMPVLRFDARGVGESEGRWATEKISVLQAYGNIQRGAWVPDTLAAIDYMRRTAKVDRIVLGGLCGGACTAIFAGAQDPSVVGVFAIGAPFTFSAASQQVSDLPDTVINDHAGRYFRKILQPASWARFLTFQTDYGTLKETLGTAFRRRLGRGIGPADRLSETDSIINLPMVEAIRAIGKRDKRLLLVYGGNDYLYQEFQEQLPRFGPDRARIFDVAKIEDANHILTEEIWQAQLYDTVTSWLPGLAAGARLRSA